MIVEETGELLGDLANHGEKLLVAAGGEGGKGNARFKSSVNRAPRQSTPGIPGESRTLQLELTLLADVGQLRDYRNQHLDLIFCQGMLLVDYRPPPRLSNTNNY